MRIRINGSTDETVYTTNKGIPQGSPLSPYLFCTHITKVMKDRITDTGQGTSMVISYVDDAAICISAKDKSTMEQEARRIWKEMRKDAKEIGMDFAEEKTKTWHDHEAKWNIGKEEERIRFLGYIIEKPSAIRRTREEDWSAPVRHWQTKGNQVYNIIRAMTQRTEKGLRTVPALRLLYACTKTMLHYGIEFWGHDEKQTKATDAYMYEALRRLFDVPKATPHRALSSEFALPPTKIQWEYIRRRLEERRKKHDPLRGVEWLKMETEDREAGSSLPWKVKSTKKPRIPKRGDTEEWEKIREIGGKEVAIFTDGSLKEGRKDRLRNSGIHGTITPEGRSGMGGSRKYERKERVGRGDMGNYTSIADNKTGRKRHKDIHGFEKCEGLDNTAEEGRPNSIYVGPAIRSNGREKRRNHSIMDKGARRQQRQRKSRRTGKERRGDKGPLGRKKPRSKCA